MLDTQTILNSFNIEEARRGHHDKSNVKKIHKTIEYKGWKFGLVEFHKTTGYDSWNISYLNEKGDFVEAGFGHPTKDGGEMLLKSLANNKFKYESILIDDYKIPKTCEDCGSNDGIETICPYKYDIHDKKVPVVLCKICHNDRAQDI